MEKLPRRDREKLVREEEILSAAEKLFSLKGFDDVSMDEIAKEAQFTKRTLYQYFENKEDLYFGVALRGFKRLFSYLEKAHKDHNSGYMRIQQTCKYLYQFNKDNPEIFRIIGYLGYVKTKSVESKRRNEFMQFNTKMFETVAEIIAEGKDDGSVHAGLDSEKAAFSLIFLITGFFNQLSTTGSSFTEHFSLNMDDFSLYTIDLLMGTLKGTRD